MKNIAYKDVKEYLSRQGLEYDQSPEYELQALLETYSNMENSLLFPYVPIRLVAIMEGYFQIQYSFIIDHGKEYRERFLKKVKNINFDNEVIGGLEQNEMSFGEYASLFLPCNRKDDIISNVNSLLGRNDFAESINDSNIFCILDEIFKYRHMFCHEIAPSIVLEKNVVIDMIKTTISFVGRTDVYIANVLFPNFYEKTQMEMTQDSENKFLCKDKELKDLITYLKSTVDNDTFLNDLDFLDEFETYREARARKVSKAFEDGSLYNCVYLDTKTEVSEELINSIKKNYKYWLRNRRV